MFSGIVIPGDKIGKPLGYPTANLDISKHEVRLKSGVYAAWVKWRSNKYPAALIIEERPWKVEVHLLQYRGPDFYGQYLEVDPVQKVSEVERYQSQAELKEKIQRDIRMIRKVLG